MRRTAHLPRTTATAGPRNTGAGAPAGPAPAVRWSIDELLDAARGRLDRVHPDALAGEVAAGALLIDIRPLEQRTRDGPMPDAIVIDRNVLEWRLDPSCEHHIAAIDSYDARIVITCNEGYQSSLAAAELRDLGLHRATDLVGGYQAWITTSHPPPLDDTD